MKVRGLSAVIGVAAVVFGGQGTAAAKHCFNLFGGDVTVEVTPP